MNQSILNPARPMAERILGLWDLMYWICAAVFVLVMLALLAAVLRRRPEIEDEEDLPGPPPPDTHRRLVKVIGAAVALTVVLLFVLLTASVATGRATAMLQGDPLSLKVTGNNGGGRSSTSIPSPAGRSRRPTRSTSRWAGRSGSGSNRAT